MANGTKKGWCARGSARRHAFVLVLAIGAVAATVAVPGIAGTDRQSGPAASAVDPPLYNRLKDCLLKALANERRALRAIPLLELRRVERPIGASFRNLVTCTAALFDRRGELKEGNAIFHDIDTALDIDREVLYLIRERRRLTKGLRRRLTKEIQEGIRTKQNAYRKLTGNAPPPEADHGCEGATAQAENEDRDDVAARCQPAGARVTSGRAGASRVPVNAIELSARRPITRFNDWAILGGVFRTGSCTRLAASLVRCPIDPPMQPGQIFVVGLAGLGAGTQVVMQIESGGRAQYIRLTTH